MARPEMQKSRMLTFFVGGQWRQAQGARPKRTEAPLLRKLLQRSSAGCLSLSLSSDLLRPELPNENKRAHQTQRDRDYRRPGGRPPKKVASSGPGPGSDSHEPSLEHRRKPSTRNALAPTCYSAHQKNATNPRPRRSPHAPRPATARRQQAKTRAPAQGLPGQPHRPPRLQPLKAARAR
jgi:hypothetical protein